MSISVLIADDNLELATLLSSFITKDKDVGVVNIVCDGENAIRSYLTYLPDVMLLDLKMPNKDGVQVLDTLCTLDTSDSQKCNIIVMSGDLENFKIRYASKVFRVLEKPFELPTLLDCIHEIYKIGSKKPSCRKLYEDAVFQLGFNFSNLGTKYLIDCIEYLHKNKIDTFSMNDLYKNIADKNNISIKKVKWNIEKSISSMYRYTKTEELKKLFPYYDGRKPTPKYVVSVALYKLKR